MVFISSVVFVLAVLSFSRSASATSLSCTGTTYSTPQTITLTGVTSLTVRGCVYNGGVTLTGSGTLTGFTGSIAGSSSATAITITGVTFGAASALTFSGVTVSSGPMQVDSSLMAGAQLIFNGCVLARYQGSAITDGVGTRLSFQGTVVTSATSEAFYYSGTLQNGAAHVFSNSEFVTRSTTANAVFYQAATSVQSGGQINMTGTTAAGPASNLSLTVTNLNGANSVVTIDSTNNFTGRVWLYWSTGATGSTVNISNSVLGPGIASYSFYLYAAGSISASAIAFANTTAAGPVLVQTAAIISNTLISTRMLCVFSTTFTVSATSFTGSSINLSNATFSSLVSSGSIQGATQFIVLQSTLGNSPGAVCVSISGGGLANGLLLFQNSTIAGQTVVANDFLGGANVTFSFCVVQAMVTTTGNVMVFQISDSTLTSASSCVQLYIGTVGAGSSYPTGTLHSFSRSSLTGGTQPTIYYNGPYFAAGSVLYVNGSSLRANPTVNAIYAQSTAGGRLVIDANSKITQGNVYLYWAASSSANLVALRNSNVQTVSISTCGASCVLTYSQFIIDTTTFSNSVTMSPLPLNSTSVWITNSQFQGAALLFGAFSLTTVNVLIQTSTFSTTLTIGGVSSTFSSGSTLTLLSNSAFSLVDIMPSFSSSTLLVQSNTIMSAVNAMQLDGTVTSSTHTYVGNTFTATVASYQALVYTTTNAFLTASTLSMSGNVITAKPSYNCLNAGFSDASRTAIAQIDGTNVFLNCKINLVWATAVSGSVVQIFNSVIVGGLSITAGTNAVYSSTFALSNTAISSGSGSTIGTTGLVTSSTFAALNGSSVDSSGMTFNGALRGSSTIHLENSTFMLLTVNGGVGASTALINITGCKLGGTVNVAAFTVNNGGSANGLVLIQSTTIVGKTTINTVGTPDTGRTLCLTFRRPFFEIDLGNNITKSSAFTEK